VYSNAELRTIYAAIYTDREGLMFHLLAYQGLRRREATGLELSDTDFRSQQMRVYGKGDKIRLIPIHPATTEMLLRARERARPSQRFYLESNRRERLSVGAFGATLNALLARAGVDGGSRPAHAFRRTVATNLYEAGVREGVIDRFMGWGPRSVRARHYTRIADASMHEAILYATDPIKESR